MNWYDKTAVKIRPDERYTRKQLVTMLREDSPGLNQGSYQWAVGGMLKSGHIIRTGFNEYKAEEKNGLQVYDPSYSEAASELLMKLDAGFPDVGFTVFETVLLNEFLNHLIARNTIFIQAEKDVSLFIFRFLQEEGLKNIMYKPSKQEFSLYWTDGCVVVEDMISEAPFCTGSPHVITLEKMLVDIYCDKLLRSIYNSAEYPEVVKQAVNHYKVEKTKMLRYAGRRNKAAEIREIMTYPD